MKIKRNILKIFCLIIISLFSITEAIEVDVNITIGLPTRTGPPPQVPWTGPLPTCETTLADNLLGDCMVNMIEFMRQSWGVGIPELEVPPMDPFTFDQITLDACSPLISFDATFSNISIAGFNNFTNLQYGLNTTQGIISYTVTFPRIRIDGFYVADGTAILTFLPLPCSGQGPFWFEFYNLRLFGSTGLRQGAVGGETVLETYDVVSNFTIDDYKFYLKDFGGPVLGVPINAVAYASRGFILPSIQPAINANNAELILLVFNKFLSTQPYLANMLSP